MERQRALRLDELIQRFGTVPRQYRGFLQSYTSVQLYIAPNVNLAVFGPAEVLQTDEDYEIARYLPGAFPLGTDFNSGLLFASDRFERRGLYRCDFGALHYAGADFVCGSLTALLEDMEGIDVLFPWHG